MNSTPVYLLDSSVLVKWFLVEDDSANARFIQAQFLEGECKLAYAELSLYEVANALLYSQQFQPKEIAQAITALSRIGMQHFSHDTVTLRQAVQLSVELGIAIYDAYLVALAQRYGLNFVSGDRRLLRRLPHLSFIQDLALFRP